MIRDSVAKLSPPQNASDDAVDVPERVDGAAVPTRSSSPRPEGTAFAPELPVFLTPDALTQLFQMDGQSRRRAITMIEGIPADAAPPGAIRVDKSLEVYLSSDRSVVFEFAYDYVDGGRSHTRVLRVYSLDEREQEATKVLLTRIGKLHRAGRASPLAYKLSKEPGKGQKYYKLPDPISVTGVMKCYRLTRKLIDIATSGQFLEPWRAVWKSKFDGVFVLNYCVVLHAIDATPARWRGDAGSSPLDRASTAASSPRNDLVKNCRVHPTHWLISTQVARGAIRLRARPRGDRRGYSLVARPDADAIARPRRDGQDANYPAVALAEVSARRRGGRGRRRRLCDRLKCFAQLGPRGLHESAPRLPRYCAQ